MSQSAIHNPQSAIQIPTYPARPVSGGALELAGPKVGQWAAEPKYNGWRALVHLPTGTMFNRHGQRLTIEAEFASSIAILRDAYHDGIGYDLEWLDCEALERRHGIGRGTLIVFDALPIELNLAYEWRREILSDHPIHELAVTEKPDHQSAYLAPSFPGAEAAALYAQLKQLNADWNTSGLSEFYEGIVMKKVSSPYPIQLRSPDHAYSYWMKHRWSV